MELDIALLRNARNRGTNGAPHHKADPDPSTSSVKAITTTHGGVSHSTAPRARLHLHHIRVPHLAVRRHVAGFALGAVSEYRIARDDAGLVVSIAIMTGECSGIDGCAAALAVAHIQ